MHAYTIQLDPVSVRLFRGILYELVHVRLMMVGRVNSPDTERMLLIMADKSMCVSG